MRSARTLAFLLVLAAFGFSPAEAARGEKKGGPTWYYDAQYGYHVAVPVRSACVERKQLGHLQPVVSFFGRSEKDEDLATRAELTPPRLDVRCRLHRKKVTAKVLRGDAEALQATISRVEERDIDGKPALFFEVEGEGVREMRLWVANGRRILEFAARSAPREFRDFRDAFEKAVDSVRLGLPAAGLRDSLGERSVYIDAEFGFWFHPPELPGPSEDREVMLTAAIYGTPMLTKDEATDVLDVYVRHTRQAWTRGDLEVELLYERPGGSGGSADVAGVDVGGPVAMLREHSGRCPDGWCHGLDLAVVGKDHVFMVRGPVLSEDDWDDRASAIEKSLLTFRLDSDR